MIDLTLPEPFNSYFEVSSVAIDPLNNTISVYVDSLNYLPASARGSMLLDLEDQLCQLDSAYRIWHKPLGDRNSLRNLRGLTIKEHLS